MGDLWVMSQYISMGYGLLQVYGLSLVTESVDAKIHGLLQVMGYHNDGLGQSRLYTQAHSTPTLSRIQANRLFMVNASNQRLKSLN